jgi:hypothetical protein
MKAITVSTKKKCRRGDKSQDQTTSKKTTTGGVVNIHKDVKDAANINNVVTPARTSMPRNKLTSIVKSSQEKTSQPNAVKKQVASFPQNMSQIGKSTTKKDLNSSNKGEDVAKLTDERNESQPAKKTNNLTKQDSSKYLRGGSQQLPTQQSLNSSTMPSNQKPAYAIHGSLIPSGAKMQGNSIDA